MNNKNIAIIVINYLNRRFNGYEAKQCFGEVFGPILWDEYMEKYKNNPLLFFEDALTEDFQNDLIMRAQIFSLSPGHQSEMEALEAMTRWPRYKMNELFKATVKKAGSVIIKKGEVWHDFEMVNGFYTAKVEEVRFDVINDRVVIVGSYDGNKIYSALDKYMEVGDCMKYYKLIIKHKKK